MAVSFLLRRLRPHNTPHISSILLQQQRTYLVLRTILNAPRTDSYTLPSDLPSPPKTAILLTTLDAATTLTPKALEPLTTSGTTAVLAAAVDSLPTPTRSKGQSWLLSDHHIRIKFPAPPPSDPSAPSTTKSSTAAPISKSITFQLPGMPSSITLPLANTLFQNGQLSTIKHIPATTMQIDLEAGEGVTNEEVVEFAEAREEIKDTWDELTALIMGIANPETLPPKDSVIVNIPVSALVPEQSSESDPQARASAAVAAAQGKAKETQTADLKPRTMLPLRKLTEPRKITSAMGNILRTISTPAGEIGASRELESVVNDAVGEGSPRGTVFARVTKSTPSSDESVDLMFSAPGIRLHRVLSGGGGWGAKSGLLSLDPQNPDMVDEFAKMFEKRFKAGEAGENADDAKDMGEAGIVEKGDWVQFFETVRVEDSAEAHLEGTRGFRFGGVAKEGEDVERSGVAEVKGGVKQADEGEVKVLEGVFGGSSENGVEMVVAGKRKVVDVPGGAVVVEFAGGKASA